MRLAFLTPEYVTESYFDGGLANYLARTAQALKERGHQVEIFVSSDEHGEANHEGVLVHRVANKLTRADRLSSSVRRRLRLPTPRKEEFRAKSLARALFARHKVAPFDVVQASNYAAVGLYVRPPRSFTFVTRCSYYHPAWWEANGNAATEESVRYNEIEMRAVRHSDRVFAPSLWLKDLFKEREGVDIDVVEPTFFVEGDAAGDAADAPGLPAHMSEVPYILYFGSLGRYKGVHLIADVLPELLQSFTDLHVVLAGKNAAFNGSSMLDYVLKRAGRHRWRVHYFGVMRHSELYPLMARADAVVLPSLVENLSNACMEAMAHGRVVVASSHASFEQLIEHGVSGLLFSNSDAASLLDAVRGALTLPARERERMGQAAMASVARLSPEHTIPLLEKYYLEAINAKK